MGLFDRFRKRVKEVAKDVNLETLTTEENESEEITSPPTHQTPLKKDDWDDITQIDKPLEETRELDLDDEWDDLGEIAPPQPKLSKAERKKLKRKEKKVDTKPRPKGSKVDLHMYRSTTGRDLVKVKSKPKGSISKSKVELETGTSIEFDLGGGIVEKGGRVIKAGKELDTLLEELEWALLEADMSSKAVSEVLGILKNQLLNSRLRKGAKLSKVVEASLKRGLTSLLKADYWDFLATVKKLVASGDKPVIIMLVGVNGTGKTTTTAKIAHLLTQEKMSVVAAAADTFRAGAIDQLKAHMDKLSIKCISGQRGGDSAAISRDAIEHAKAKNIDVVLVDTAGRMQNKSNLMQELNKVHRVTNPHLVLFVGDALAGNDAVEQATEFQQILKFDGAVLAKMDTDAKGGAGLSIAHATGRPIVLVGTGQKYTDLMQFQPEWLLEQLFE